MRPKFAVRKSCKFPSACASLIMNRSAVGVETFVAEGEYHAGVGEVLCTSENFMEADQSDGLKQLGGSLADWKLAWASVWRRL